MEIKRVIATQGQLWHELQIVKGLDYNNNNLGIDELVLTVKPVNVIDLLQLSSKFRQLELNKTKVLIRAKEGNVNYLKYLRKYMTSVLNVEKINVAPVTWPTTGKLNYKATLAKLMTIKSLVIELEEVGSYIRTKYVGDYKTLSSDKDADVEYVERYYNYKLDVVINIVSKQFDIAMKTAFIAKKLGLYVSVNGYESNEHKHAHHDDSVFEEHYKKFFGVDEVDKELFFIDRLKSIDTAFFPMKYDKEEFCLALDVFEIDSELQETIYLVADELGVFVKDEDFYEDTYNEDGEDDE